MRGRWLLLLQTLMLILLPNLSLRGKLRQDKKKLGKFGTLKTI
jgi:hypothetical protein